ncbi:hypothetical protein [Oricola indica]|uniref:hypothetical protein n=1 Tax=Oricola indica TaxID=2872591 RepID=UPI001CC02901|nr:hypothetical protein [Oricola indica]
MDERLAKGEITTEEHEALASRLRADDDRTAAHTHSPPRTELPRGSFFWAALGIGVGVAMYITSSNLVEDIIARCMDRANTFAWCKENGVKWPLIYLWNGFAIFLGLFGLINLVLPKGKAS